MNRKPFLVGLIVGGLLGLIPGFGLGVYFLPIIIAEQGADETVLAGAHAAAERRGMFVRDLPGGDPRIMPMVRLSIRLKMAKRSSHCRAM